MSSLWKKPEWTSFLLEECSAITRQGLGKKAGAGGGFEWGHVYCTEASLWLDSE